MLSCVTNYSKIQINSIKPKKTSSILHPIYSPFLSSPSPMASTSAKFKQLAKKYGKVALGVHLSVSAASVTGLYIAINNNVDVESLLRKVGIGRVPVEHAPPPVPEKSRNRTAELGASVGGAVALAVLCNKALFPIRVPITVALTPPIARFLAKRNFYRRTY